MRRSALYLSGWFLTAMVAVLLAWAGVRTVADQVTGNRPAPLSYDQVLAHAEDEGSDDLGDDGTTTAAEATAATPSTTVPVTSPPPTDAPSSPVMSEAPATTVPGAPSTAPPVTGAPPPPPPTTAAPPPAPAAAEESRTYALVGGSAALRFSPSGVTVLWANPNPGFSVKVEPEHGNGMKVEFRADHHRSRVDGWWNGGPQDRVREDADR